MAYTDKQTPSQRYYIESPAPGLYEAHDVKSGVFVTFEDKQFKDTQEWHFPADPALVRNEKALNRIADGLEAWLLWHHPDIMSEDSGTRYSLTLSADKKTVVVVRSSRTGGPADPEIVVTFPATSKRKSVASLVRNIAKYLRDSAPDWDNVDF